MKASLLALLFLAAVITIFSAPLPVEDEQDESGLIEVPDVQLEDELRRRGIGGPWEPGYALKILEEAIDQLKSNYTKRTRKFHSQASALLELLTGQCEPTIDLEGEPDTAEMYEDPLSDDEDIRWTPSRETMQKIVDMIDGLNGQRRRSMDSIENLYPNFRSYMIPRFRKRLATTNRREKFMMIDQHVYSVFKQSRQELKPVHGRMLQRWARQYAQSIDLTDFKASKKWLYLFKKRNNIVGRKVTYYLGKAEQRNEGAIAESIVNFRQNYTRDSKPFNSSFIWNFDQVGFNYEPSNLRTLSMKGERDVTLLLDQKRKMTHSYTVQPMISRDGRLFGKLLLVMQEQANTWGKNIGPEVARLERLYGNIEVYPHTSGKVTRESTFRWYNGTLKCAVNHIRGNRTNNGNPIVLILADSYGGHSKEDQIQSLSTIGVKMMRIPKSTTDVLQPLDVNYNRQMKIFYNRIIEEAFYQNITGQVTSREGILNVHSLMHNQFSSAQYRDMIKYAWRNTDPSFDVKELTNYPPKMVNDIQFNIDDANTCQVEGCEEHAFLKCSHCGKHLCLKHFLQRECFHTFQNRSRAKRNYELLLNVLKGVGAGISIYKDLTAEEPFICNANDTHHYL